MERLHDRLDAETKSSIREWTGEARAAGQLIQALQAQVSTLQLRLAEVERAPASGGGTRPATLAEIIERRNALREIREAGLSAGEARAAGYTCADVKAVGYSLLEAKAAGWLSDELRMVGYVDSKGMSSREFFDRYQAGCTNFSGLDFSGEDFSRMVLDRPCSFAGCNLSNSTFDHATLCGIDFSEANMPNADLSHVKWGPCNFTNSRPLLRDRFTIQQLKQMGCKGGSTTGYSCSEAKQAGCSLSEMKQAGYSCSEAKQAGYSPQQCKDAGYDITEITSAGWAQQSWNSW